MEIFVGDYVDRGPASAAVIERLCHAPSGRTRVCLLGNHDQMMLQVLETADPLWLEQWVLNGGDATLRSYGVPVPYDLEREARATTEALRDRLPGEHRAFLEALRPTERLGGTLFVHAGLRPGIPIAEQDPHDLVWIRDEFMYARDADFARAREPRCFVVHGHTPSTEGPELTPWRLNVDTGAFATGRLTCAVIEDGAVDLLSPRRS